MVAYKGILTEPKAPKVPDYLIYEIMDGKPLYYKGYQQVLKKKKTPEEIMGASGLQSIVVSYLFKLLVRFLNDKQYHTVASETGVHLDHRNNMANDLAVYDRSVLTPDKITTKYIDVPPKLAIEIDIKADISSPEDADYLQRKTQKLLDFGTEKVIWIFTHTQKIMIAPKGQDWHIVVDWNKEIELIDGLFFNIGNYLNEEGIQLTPTE